MVVLAPLIFVTVLLVAIVVAGKLLYPPAPHYLMPTRPAKELAASEGVIYSAGRPVRRIEKGDTVWVVRAGNGLPVVFADSSGMQVLGVGEVFLSPLGGR